MYEKDPITVTDRDGIEDHKDGDSRQQRPYPGLLLPGLGHKEIESSEIPGSAHQTGILSYKQRDCERVDNRGHGEFARSR